MLPSAGRITITSGVFALIPIFGLQVNGLRAESIKIRSVLLLYMLLQEFSTIIQFVPVFWDLRLLW